MDIELNRQSSKPDPRDMGAWSLLRALSLTLTAGCMILIVLQLYLLGRPNPGALIGCSIGLSVYAFVRRNRLRVAARIMCWGLSLTAMVAIYQFGGANNATWVAMPVAVMTSGWYLGRRDSLLLVVFQTLYVVWIAVLQAQGHQFQPYWNPYAPEIVVALGILTSMWVAIGTNNTFRQQLNETNQAKQQLGAIIDSTQDLIWSVDSKDFRLLWFNLGFREYLNTRYDFTVQNGMSAEDFPLPDEVRQVWIGYFNRALESGPFSTEYYDATQSVTLYVSVHLIRQGKDVVAISVFCKNITELKEAEEAIKTLAYFDPLTKLPNRRLLMERLRLSIASSNRSNRHCAVLFIDLDNFKMLNDTLGHDVGDMLLQQVAARLTACLREEDTVVRLGGDEFVILVESLSIKLVEAVTEAEIIAEKILAEIVQTFQLEGHVHHCTASIGVTIFSGHQDTVDELLKRADLAMYQAKNAGRNTIRFFDPEMQSVVKSRMDMEADLREAILGNQFFLCYQMQITSGGMVTGAEVLLRWQHPVRGLVSPLEFIPLAEENGLILPIGLWVLQEVCRQLAIWSASEQTAHLTLSVNISSRQFKMPNFVDEVESVIKDHNVNPKRIKLELTESILVDNLDDLIVKMSALKLRGVGFSLDDFGTGYSSLSYLKRLPLDQLKIDQSFVRDILTDPNDAAIAEMIIVLADSLGLEVIAEGVEEIAQQEFLARHGCHCYQGYLFGRPMPLQEFEAALLEPQVHAGAQVHMFH